MSVFIISTFVVFVTVRATSLPQSDWDSLGLATLAKEIPNQQLSSLESGRFSISDEPKGSINSQEISSIEPTKGTLINNLAASSGDESDFQDEERVFHSPDEQFDDTDGGTRFGGNAKEIKTTSCTGAYKQGDEREKSEGSGKCAADEPRRPAIRKTNPGERTIPGHDLLPKLPQRKPLAETDDDFHEWDFCPPSHRALCCRGPTVLKLRDGIAAGNCGNCTPPLFYILFIIFPTVFP